MVADGSPKVKINFHCKIRSLKSAADPVHFETLMKFR